MKFNPITKTLLTDQSEFIKKLHCPYNVKWHTLLPSEFKNHRFCDICVKDITNVSFMSDEEVKNAVKNNPEICLCVNLDAKNIRVEYFPE